MTTTAFPGPLLHRLTLSIEIGTGEPGEVVLARLLNKILDELTISGAELNTIAVEMTAAHRSH
jgi:uncharacterized protein YlxW (UPF0749 family)